jgi:hypothetical protein
MIALFLLSGCGSNDEGDDGGGNGNTGGDGILFPSDYESTYTFVRDCRSSIDHAGVGGGIKVYADASSADDYNALWAAPDTAVQLPEGTTLVKEVYGTSDCTGEVGSWVVMKKEAGFDPSNNDWHWQNVGADRTIINGEDGSVDRCISCHDGSQGSCNGFGAQGGLDYTCTEKLPTDP